MKIRFFLLPILSTIILVSCRAVPTLKGAKVTRQSIDATVTSVNSGVVKSEHMAELAFGAVGRVRVLNVKLGDVVPKDFIIAELENQDAQNALEMNAREAERQKGLLERGLSSKTLVDQQQSVYHAAQMAYDKTIIRAPFSGIIAELNLEIGQLSQITTEFKQALVRIVDQEPRYVRAEIDEVDLPKVKVGQSAEMKILAIRREPYKAVVRKVVPYVSSIREQDRTSEIELNVVAEELLPVGASADVEIVVDRHESVLVVPVRSILGRGNKRFVYKFEDSRAKKVEVGLGITNYDLAEVTSGLKEGDLVLIPSDAVELEDGKKVSLESQ